MPCQTAKTGYSPLMSTLPLLPGNTLLAGLSGHLADGQGPMTLSVLPLGRLALPTGMLAVVDPFAEMTRGGNPGVRLFPGDFNVVATRAGSGADSDGTPVERNAYLTLVLDEAYWAKRTTAPGKTTLRYLHLTLDGHVPEEVDLMNEGEFAGVPVSAGTCALVDDGALAEYMPPDLPGEGWADTVFDHGLEGSWFDAMDATFPLPHGCANLPLPLATTGAWGTPNVVLAESGYGDGYYPVIGEYDPMSLKEGHMPHLVAIHVDFGVVPRVGPVASSTGPR
jgi:hypothetical protein